MALEVDSEYTLYCTAVDTTIRHRTRSTQLPFLPIDGTISKRLKLFCAAMLEGETASLCNVIIAAAQRAPAV